MTESSQPAGAAPSFQLQHRLRLALEVSHCSVADMAAELGVARNTVGNYLAGRSRPSRAVLRVWALRTGVPFEWLCGDRWAVTLRYRPIPAA